MAKKYDINLTEVVNYILDNKITLREYSRQTQIPVSTLYYHIKNYSGAREKELAEYFAQNKETSRKNCGYYHWKNKKL